MTMKTDLYKTPKVNPLYGSRYRENTVFGDPVQPGLFLPAPVSNA